MIPATYLTRAAHRWLLAEGRRMRAARRVQRDLQAVLRVDVLLPL